jgi:hypothetical protein
MKASALAPGDPILSVTGDEAFAIIVSPSQIRGVNGRFEITDTVALRESLTAADQGGAQIAALLGEPISLAKYIELVRLEIDCITQFGLDTSPMTIDKDAFGLSVPGYGVSLGASSFDDGQLAFIQAKCQNYYTGAYQWFYRGKFGLSKDDQTGVLVASANKYVACAMQAGVEVPFAEVTSDSLDQFFAWFATDDTSGCGPFP